MPTIYDDDDSSGSGSEGDYGEGAAGNEMDAKVVQLDDNGKPIGKHSYTKKKKNPKKKTTKKGGGNQMVAQIHTTKHGKTMLVPMNIMSTGQQKHHEKKPKAYVHNVPIHIVDMIGARFQANLAQRSNTFAIILDIYTPAKKPITITNAANAVMAAFRHVAGGRFSVYNITRTNNDDPKLEGHQINLEIYEKTPFNQNSPRAHFRHVMVHLDPKEENIWKAEGKEDVHHGTRYNLMVTIDPPKNESSYIPKPHKEEGVVVVHKDGVVHQKPRKAIEN